MADAPTAKYALATDYSQDYGVGTWTRLGGAIGSGATIKATYNSAGRIILTPLDNMIMCFNIDNIRLERDRNIYKGVDEFALSIRVFCTFEETDAVVLLKNIAAPA